MLFTLSFNKFGECLYYIWHVTMGIRSQEISSNMTRGQRDKKVRRQVPAAALILHFQCGCSHSMPH